MPKQHFCKTISDTVICGERDPEKFEPGRYSICKKCRTKATNNVVKKRRELEKEVKLKEIKSNISISDIAKDTFLKIPVRNGETIEENFDSVIRSINQLQEDRTGDINLMNMNISLFQKKQNEFQKEHEDLKKKYDELMKYCISIQKYVSQITDTKSGPFIPEKSIVD
jgi:cellulose biosynthesis protein BcsQ